MRRGITRLQLEREQLLSRGQLVLDSRAARAPARDSEPELGQETMVEAAQHLRRTVILAVAAELLADALPQHPDLSGAESTRAFEHAVEVVREDVGGPKVSVSRRRRRIQLRRRRGRDAAQLL
jgi:hypothetical protein